MKPEPFILPSLPQFTENQWKEADQTKNYNPILFEMYKHVAIIAATSIQIHPEVSPDTRDIPPRHWALLIALLNRCCRIMLSNIALSHKGLHAETLKILERCITESAINILWLCEKDDPSLFDRYLADGTKNDIELRNFILNNIEQRNGKKFIIEQNMLDSIDRLIRSTGLSSKKIEATPRLPNFKQRLDSLNFNEQHYLVLQKMGSHSIHGTWPDLFKYYLEWDENERFSASDHNSRPHETQYIFICFIVLSAIHCFLDYIVISKFAKNQFAPQLKETEDLLGRIYSSLYEDDFDETGEPNKALDDD